MPTFRVLCFKAGEMDGDPHKVNAADEQTAAEQVCGEPLVEAGKPGQLRAQVSLVSKPGIKKMFYVRP
jgi:hypothetical protein